MKKMDELGKDRLKYCKRCDTIKPFEDFNKNKNNKFGLSANCRLCIRLQQQKLQEESPSKLQLANRRSYIKRQYGITLEEYEAKLESQNYRCAVCNADVSAKASAHLDHNHDTNALRDFLCYRCNVGIGYFKDSVDVLIAAANYLARHQEGAEVENLPR